MNESIKSPDGLDLRLLKSFRRVAQLGSMALAASDLGYVPSAISQHVSALERSIGDTPLFTRKPGSRLTLTAAGRALADAVDDLFVATTSFSDVSRQISRGEGLVLRIGAYGTALGHLLPDALSRLLRTDSRLSVQTTEIEPIEGLPLLERGDVDLLIAHGYLPEDRPAVTDNMTMTSLGRESLLLVSSSTEAAARLSFHDCSARDWVAGAPRDVDRRLLNRWAADAGIHPRVRHETRDCHTAAEIIAGGLAVGLLPASVVQAPSFGDRLAVIQLPKTLPRPTREVLAITRKEFRMPLVASLLVELGHEVKAMRP
ncbi:MAG: LysR family transcriptional regulator [Mycobacteriaceae bacterium]